MCVTTPGGDPNHMTDDLISHLLVDHHGGHKPDANISFQLFLVLNVIMIIVPKMCGLVCDLFLTESAGVWLSTDRVAVELIGY